MLSATRILDLGCIPSEGNSCSGAQISFLNSFREIALASSLGAFLKMAGAGAWLCNCYVHPIASWNHYWANVEVPAVKVGRPAQTLRDTFISWYTGNATRFDEVCIDGNWGANLSCEENNAINLEGAELRIIGARPLSLLSFSAFLNSLIFLVFLFSLRFLQQRRRMSIVRLHHSES